MTKKGGQTTERSEVTQPLTPSQDGFMGGYAGEAPACSRATNAYPAGHLLACELRAAFLHLLGLPRNDGVFGGLSAPHLLRICSIETAFLRQLPGMNGAMVVCRAMPRTLTYAPNRENCARGVTREKTENRRKKRGELR